MIAEGIIATNRHVAEVFARKRGDGGDFLMTFLGTPYRARIDFREEYEETEHFEVPIEEIIFLEDADRPCPTSRCSDWRGTAACPRRSLCSRRRPGRAPMSP